MRFMRNNEDLKMSIRSHNRSPMPMMIIQNHK